MQSTVWHTDLCASPGRSLIDKTGELLRAAGISGRIAPGDLTAVKLHFGERGNVSFVRPVFVRKIIAEIAAARVTERGSRADDKASEAAMEDRKKLGYF